MAGEQVIQAAEDRMARLLKAFDALLEHHNSDTLDKERRHGDSFCLESLKRVLEIFAK